MYLIKNSFKWCDFEPFQHFHRQIILIRCAISILTKQDSWRFAFFCMLKFLNRIQHKFELSYHRKKLLLLLLRVSLKNHINFLLERIRHHSSITLTRKISWMCLVFHWSFVLLKSGMLHLKQRLHTKICGLIKYFVLIFWFSSQYSLSHRLIGKRTFF